MIEFTASAASAIVARKDMDDLVAMVHPSMSEYFCPVLIEAAAAEITRRQEALADLRP